MELKTNFPNRKGFLTNAELIDSAKVETESSLSRSRKGNFKAKIQAKIEYQCNGISNRVERQMKREQHRRMKKLGLA